MKHLKTNHLALRSLIAVMTLGMMFLPGAAFADEPGESPPAFPAVTELPLLGSNITIELGMDESGVLASVTVDGELADFDLEVDDDEIKIEFLLSNANGDFTVEVKFENDDMKIEVEATGPTAPGDYVWAGQACDGGAFSIAYTVTAEGTLVLGATTGDVVKTEAGDDEIELRFADGTKVELEMDDDGLSIEQKCQDRDDDSDDHDSDDDSDDHDSDDDSDDHDSDDDSDDHDSDDHDSDDHDSDDDSDDDEDDDEDDEDEDDDEDDEDDDDDDEDDDQ